MSRRGRRAGTAHDRGQSAVELALVLPLVAVLLLVVAQAGLVVRDQVLVVHAAREAARAAAVAPASDADAARRGATRAGPLDPARLAVRVEVAGDGSTVRVEVRYRSRTSLPIIGALLPDPELTAAAVMGLE